MGIGLKIVRPEAAIADPSRLIIKSIYPTYICTESFLESACFHIKKDAEAHGGFNPKNDLGSLALGIGNEPITGIMPLYLFPQHWEIARRKLQPVYGLMCSLDVMGYSAEQFYTIPFLVFIRLQ